MDLSRRHSCRFSKDIIDSFAEVVKAAFPALSSIVRKVIPRDYFWMVDSYFRKALVTQNNAVFGFSCSPLLYGNTRHMARSVSWTNILATLSTISTKPISFTLSRKSCENSSLIKSHNKSSPSYSYTWRKGRTLEDWWYLENGKWTGIHIYKRTYVLIPTNTNWKIAGLNPPSFEVTFHPNGDSNFLLNLVELPTFKQAKKLAEWYYKKWLTSNRNTNLEKGDK